MATVTGDSNTAVTCPNKDPVPYERIIIDLEDRPVLKKEVEEATDLLDFVLCRVPDPQDPKYKDDEVGWQLKIQLINWKYFTKINYLPFIKKYG